MFPARAGMDRLRLLSPRLHVSVPRASGDGPKSAKQACRRAVCSPRERGWTGGAGLAGIAYFVFPARAGMDRMTSNTSGGQP